MWSSWVSTNKSLKQISKKTREFYKRFYDYTLSDEELQSILHPKDKMRYSLHIKENLGFSENSILSAIKHIADLPAKVFS